MIFREDKGTGYMYCYKPDHYCANSVGKVFEHTFVMSEFIGRKLHPNEVVHHKDRNRKNNNLDNLQLMTLAEHDRLHVIEDRGFVEEHRPCKECGNNFKVSVRHKQNYCSSKCASKSTRQFEVTREELEDLVWSTPTTKVAELFGVSDSAIGKRCKKLGIKKPPVGYWAKVYAGKI